MKTKSGKKGRSLRPLPYFEQRPAGETPQKIKMVFQNETPRCKSELTPAETG
ncbi:hypothetical protein VG539_000805 [Cronobacter muytjensii]|uniref:hypothetical protein n=1 Tax=Cronobacter muytjensii TaxID=413501 RepID=UPI0024A81120|nr:hypothetical protein [Cronobacter muytjensii]MDI6457544.1 hypothetical protein [Cronobacter muytjensii]